MEKRGAHRNGTTSSGVRGAEAGICCFPFEKRASRRAGVFPRPPPAGEGWGPKLGNSFCSRADWGASRAGTDIISALPECIMEAERINSIASSLADLARRETELRRYL